MQSLIVKLLNFTITQLFKNDNIWMTANMYYLNFSYCQCWMLLWFICILQIFENFYGRKQVTSMYACVVYMLSWMRVSLWLQMNCWSTKGQMKIIKVVWLAKVLFMNCGVDSHVHSPASLPYPSSSSLQMGAWAIAARLFLLHWLHDLRACQVLNTCFLLQWML